MYPQSRSSLIMATVCAICLEDVTSNNTILPCRHEFHRSCLNSWTFAQATCLPACPNCRRVYLPLQSSLRFFNRPFTQVISFGYQERNFSQWFRHYDELRGNYLTKRAYFRVYDGLAYGDIYVTSGAPPARLILCSICKEYVSSNMSLMLEHKHDCRETHPPNALT